MKPLVFTSRLGASVRLIVLLWIFPTPRREPLKAG